MKGPCCPGRGLITSDDHGGLKAARQAVFGAVPWQRCQFHLQHNAQAHVPRQEMKAYEASAPKLSAWIEANLPEGLSVFALPEAHRRLLRTTNGLERVNKEVRRRTRVATLFPSEASCLRLVSAVLMEISDEWEAGKAYLTFNE